MVIEIKDQWAMLVKDDTLRQNSKKPYEVELVFDGSWNEFSNLFKEESQMENILNWSVVISIIGVLVVLTNIIVQVLKKVTWGKLPTNILAVAVSMVLTLAAFFAYCQIKAIAVVWYMVAAAVVLGFMVSYAAMFGYDKLMEAIGKAGKVSKIDQELGQKVKNQ